MKHKSEVQLTDPLSTEIAGNAPPAAENEITRFASVKEKPRLEWKENRRLLFIGAGIIVVLLLFALDGITRRSPKPGASVSTKQQHPIKPEGSAPTESLAPILETPRAEPQDIGGNRVDPEEVGRTATRQLKPSPGRLADITPFDGSQWQPPPYQPGKTSEPVTVSAAALSGPPQGNRDHDVLDKASLVFVKSSASAAADEASQDAATMIDSEVGLAPGTRLRARLESAVNTAVRTPVVAVIEYNYEKNGELVVPAGAKVFGHVDSADHSGYIGIRFESLRMPDGASIPIEAAATDIHLRPLRGRVEGRQAGKNLVVRSLAGLGQIAATLVGRGSLNQPLGEGDLLRERVANNIGQASDQSVSNLSLSARFLVSLPADAEIYVVLQKSTERKVDDSSTRRMGEPTHVKELQQRLQMQREPNPAGENRRQY